MIKASAPDDDLRDARTAVALAKGIDASARSDDWSTLSVLAAVYAEVGDFDKAVAFIDEAIRCAPRALAERFVQRRDQYMKHVRYRLPAAGFDGLVSAARCDACGAVAFCSDGLPGTPRTVLCLDCAKRHFAADVDE